MVCRHLPPIKHCSHGPGFSGVGEPLDDAQSELELARRARDPIAKHIANTMERLENISGGARSFDLTTDDETPDPRYERCMRLRGLACSEFGLGHWGNGQQLMRAARDAYPHDGERFPGLTPLPRFGREDCPRWTGERVGNLLLLAYAGNGDAFHFARYVEVAARRCDHVTLAVRPPLHAIAKRALAGVKVVTISEAKPYLQRADAYETLDIWLAGVLGVQYERPLRIAPLPDSVPDLGEGLHVGLCWAASAATWDNGKNRTIPFAALAPLRSLPGAQFHSLQYGANADDCDDWVARHDISAYELTASLIAALNAVVTVDTSVAHLAAQHGQAGASDLDGLRGLAMGNGKQRRGIPR